MSRRCMFMSLLMNRKNVPRPGFDETMVDIQPVVNCGRQEVKMTRLDCDNHQPQTTGFPWEHPKGLVTWCPVCKVLEVNDEFMGRLQQDTDGGSNDWLFCPVPAFNWINITMMEAQNEDY